MLSTNSNFGKRDEIKERVEIIHGVQQVRFPNALEVAVTLHRTHSIGRDSTVTTTLEEMGYALDSVYPVEGEQLTAYFERVN